MNMVARRAAAAGVQAAIEAAGGRRGTAGGRGIDAATGPAAGRGAGPAAGRGGATGGGRAPPPIQPAADEFRLMLRRLDLNDAAILALEGFGLDSLDAIHNLTEGDIPAIT
jgi:hypothetical protein